MKYYSWLILLLLIDQDLLAGDSSIVSFSVGNKYVYGGSQHCPGGITTPKAFSETIISDTLINGRTFFKVLRSPALSVLVAPSDTAAVFYRRADSTSIYQYNIGAQKEDTLVDFNDTIGTLYSTGYRILLRSSTYSFGVYYPSIIMSTNSITYSSKLFLVRYWPAYLCSEDFSLVAAKINGVYYGDSTLLSVNQKGGSVFLFPDYVLYQNYPNPFNPITQIEYYIPQSSYVTLTINDILGRKVGTLVDEQVEGGHHTVNFDGSSFSSGIYFYCLQGGNSIQIKKLVLLK